MKTFTSFILVVTLALAPATFVTGCATAGPVVSQNPTVEQQAALRALAARIVDGITTGLQITRAAGRFVDTLPITNAEKNDFDRAIIAVTGTTAKPGPLPAALEALQSVTSEASLKATLTTVFTVLDPLIVKLETHTNVGVAGFGISLRAAVSFAKSYLNGGVR